MSQPNGKPCLVTGNADSFQLDSCQTVSVTETKKATGKELSYEKYLHISTVFDGNGGALAGNYEFEVNDWRGTLTIDSPGLAHWEGSNDLTGETGRSSFSYSLVPKP